MNSWTELFRKPTQFSDAAAAQWFAKMADKLLNRTLWMIAGIPHRLTEIEFYFRGPGLEDPFAHANPLQGHTGRWYFHMIGSAFRGGTYKGLDITFGDIESRAGILIRGIETQDGELIDGPSLVVDRLLACNNTRTIAEMISALGIRPMWDESSPLHVVDAPDLCKPIFATARVGLSLRRTQAGSSKFQFLTRPYRFLSEPARIRKGKAQMVLAMHRSGRAADEIRRLTGCPISVIATYVQEYTRGLIDGCTADFLGGKLSPRDLCRLHGIADRT